MFAQEELGKALLHVRNDYPDWPLSKVADHYSTFLKDFFDSALVLAVEADRMVNESAPRICRKMRTFEDDVV